MVSSLHAPGQNHSSPQADLISEFPEIFNGQVKAMQGEEFHIQLSDDAKPFCVKTPRAIPFAYRDKLKVTDLARARDHHPGYTPHRVVCSDCCDPEEGHR